MKRLLQSFLAAGLMLVPLCLKAEDNAKARAASITLKEFKISQLKFIDALKAWSSATRRYADKGNQQKEISVFVNEFGPKLGGSAPPSISLDLKNVTAEDALNKIVDQITKGGMWKIYLTWDGTPGATDDQPIAITTNTGSTTTITNSKGTPMSKKESLFPAGFKGSVDLSINLILSSLAP